MEDERIHHPVLFKKALRLEYGTILWNIIEGIISITIGLATGSISLFAYGLSSSIEVFTSGVVIWDLKGASKKREKQALRFIGVAYIVVSLYIFYEAVKSIMSFQQPDREFSGIIFMALTALIMAFLGVSKYRIGRSMQSATMLANAKFSLIDGLLSVAVLIGLLFNTIFGLWWVDQAIALFIAGVAFREGLKELL